jgi:hypothetical protein
VLLPDNTNVRPRPAPSPPGEDRQSPFAVYSAAVGSVTVPGWPMAAMAARCK